MQSFRTEIENPLVERDILELERKIFAFKHGTLNEEKFRSLRLARGIYGQRQKGVQMIRIKIPIGKLNANQLIKIADVSDEFSNGNIHLTTRQDIQIHYVNIDRTPQLWAHLEEEQITLREACGNTIRNVTASPQSGIDPTEPFDVSPYAYAVFDYFLRKPFAQELGRKIKIAFSNSEKDSAFTFIHDIGFIPKLLRSPKGEQKGFKVLIGGGLGAQPILALTAFEFLSADEIIPFIESVVRVFDYLGERTNRHKARLKFLVQKIGLPAFLDAVAAARNPAYKYAIPPIIETAFISKNVPQGIFTTFRPANQEKYKKWRQTNTFHQKQKGFTGVFVRVKLGNLNSTLARKLSKVVALYSADDIRITPNQGFLIRFVPHSAIPALYEALTFIGLSDPGFDSIADITACPGTDTCNLAISNSTEVTKVLEQIIENEFEELIYESDLKIKISGCMNACGQHSIAQIGFHGSSFKAGDHVLPALQVLLGGGVTGNGNGGFGDKIIKVASKKGPDVLRSILRDFKKNRIPKEVFNSYYSRKGKDYFYQLLKPFGDTKNLIPDDFIDWGQKEKFKTEIGVGECAGVMIDLSATLLLEAKEKLEWSKLAISELQWSDSVYHCHAALIGAAKALLLAKDIHVNSHHAVVSDFEKYFIETGVLPLNGGFKECIQQTKEVLPTENFALLYYNKTEDLVRDMENWLHERTKIIIPVKPEEIGTLG